MFFCVRKWPCQALHNNLVMPSATTWIHEVCFIKMDAVCVSRLHNCGVIFLRKANMHELGMGMTRNNPNYG